MLLQSILTSEILRAIKLLPNAINNSSHQSSGGVALPSTGSGRSEYNLRANGGGEGGGERGEGGANGRDGEVHAPLARSINRSKPQATPPLSSRLLTNHLLSPSHLHRPRLKLKTYLPLFLIKRQPCLEFPPSFVGNKILQQ